MKKKAVRFDNYTMEFMRLATAEEWQSEDPIIPDGVFGYDTTTLVLKMGDGKTKWSDLNPVNGKSAELQKLTISDGINTIEYDGSKDGSIKIPRPQYKIISMKYSDIGSLGTTYELSTNGLSPSSPAIAIGDSVHFRTDKASYIAYVSAVNGDTISATVRFAGALPENVPTALNQLTEDATHRTVTDTEKSSWTSKADVSMSVDLAGTTSIVVDKVSLNFIRSGSTLSVTKTLIP